MYLGDLILQIPGLTPTYTKHPIFPDLFSAMIVAAHNIYWSKFCVRDSAKKNY